MLGFRRASEKEKQSRPSAGTLAGIGFVILVLYVLSPMPLQYSADFVMGQLPEEMYGDVKWIFHSTCEVVYAPLDWLYEHVRAVAAFYDWYSELFGY